MNQLNRQNRVISKTISHYRILNKLGAGGMGEVYLAEDTKLDRKVAMKVIRAIAGADEIAKKRLIREAQAAARLDHPNICAIHEVGEADGESFIVMQYVEGETLADRIIRKPLDLRESLDVAVQVADALSEAHSQGIIHRDIKPQNIMLTLRGQVKVMDFGLAKVIQRESVIDSAVDTQSTLTDPGVLVGTVPYLSPEQVRGETADGRSDIFSFGTMLYKMVTGIHPFAADSDGATISAILTRQPPPLARYAASVPLELERIEHKCLEKDRERRYQSAREVLVDLRTLQRGLDSSTVAFETVSPRRESKTRRFVFVVLFAAIVAALVGGLYFFAVHNEATGKAIGSVAVLPFVNVGADPNTEYLSDGITDGLINSLSQLPNLKVIARSSVFRYKGRDADAQAVGRDLRVRAVLTGKVTQLGDTLSISAELADARDNSHIWGAQYNRKLSDIFLLQGEISKDISEKLRLTLSGEQERRLTKRQTDSAEAYQLYLKGRYFLSKRTEDGIKKSIDYFEQAIRADQNYALAYAGLADSYAVIASSGFDILPASQLVPKAKDAARKALELDNDIAEAHTSLGLIKMWYEWDWSGAEEEFKRAIELNPSQTAVDYSYTSFLIATGRQDEALAESRRVLELDPISFNAALNFIRALYSARQFEDAIQQCLKLLEMDPNQVPVLRMLAVSYEQRRMYDQALDTQQKVVTLTGGSLVSKSVLGHIYGLAGNTREAIKILKDIESHPKQKQKSYYMAMIYAALGQQDQAIDWLERAFQERSTFLIFIKTDFALEPLHSHPKFAALVRRVGLDP
jgi:eukaryotic-like serine/threonine-protein kinase